MTNFAYVENGEIKKVLHTLPKNWVNISNFYAIDDESVLNRYGWYTIQKTTPLYDPATQLLGDPIRTFANNQVIETITIIQKPIVPVPVPAPAPSEEEVAQQIAAQLATQWDIVRQLRDTKMQEFDWRYVRHARQTRMNLPLSDNIADLDAYMQALADITQQSDPYNLIWPEYTVTPVVDPQGPQGELPPS